MVKKGVDGDGRRVPGGNDKYRKYHSSTKMKKERALRNKARREYEAKNGDLPRTTEIDHIKPFHKGGGNSKSNLRAVSKAFNRGRSRR